MLTTMLAAGPAAALQTTAAVEEVVSAGGIRAYLARESSIPFLSLMLHVKGGSASDPAGKDGLAYMASGLLDEGAGPYDSQAFRAELEDNAIRLSFEADRDGLTGELRTLTATRAHAFELLRLAVTAPRFDAEPVERIRSQILGGGGFSSRLLEEIREKRGLAYSAYSYLYELDAAPLWLGGVATNNQQVVQSIAAALAATAADLDEVGVPGGCPLSNNCRWRPRCTICSKSHVKRKVTIFQRHAQTDVCGRNWLGQANSGEVPFIIPFQNRDERQPACGTAR